MQYWLMLYVLVLWVTRYVVPPFIIMALIFLIFGSEVMGLTLGAVMIIAVFWYLIKEA